MSGTPATAVVDPSTVDLTDVELFVRGEHHAALAALREHRPVHWNEGADGHRFWALTGYDDVVWAYRDHECFSSRGGAVVGGSFRSEEDTSAGRMLVASDLPRHRMLKQAVHPALAASVVVDIGRTVARLLDDALARARADGGCDFATSIAWELPAGALMVVMGIDRAQAHELIRLTRRVIGFRDAGLVEPDDDPALQLAGLQADVFEFFADLLAERTDRSGDDLLGVLLRAEVNGRPLTEEEVLYNCMNVAIGGNETSSYTACTGLLALLEHPDQYDLLRSDPAVLDTAVEEILRWSSTNAYVHRVATRDVVRHGELIRAGDSVTLWNVSANRDGSRFPAPDRFDMTRTPNRHLAYGAGLHRCIGAPAAAGELSLLFSRIAAADVRFHLAGPPRRLRSNFILGITELPVELR